MPAAARSAALAGLFADDLAKGGKGEIDVAAAEKMIHREPFEYDGAARWRSDPLIAFPCLLGRYLDLHGKPELAVRCWKHCLVQTDYVADYHRTLAAAELLSRGVALESGDLHSEKAAEEPAP